MVRMCYKIVYQDETEQYTEAFDADDPIQVDRYPAYYIDRPWRATTKADLQHQQHHQRKATRKLTEH